MAPLVLCFTLIRQQFENYKHGGKKKQNISKTPLKSKTETAAIVAVTGKLENGPELFEAKL